MCSTIVLEKANAKQTLQWFLIGILTQTSSMLFEKGLHSIQTFIFLISLH